MESPGYVDGRHYTAYVDELRQLKRTDDLDRAERLLLRLVAAIEAEARVKEWGVAPWYYEQLAIIYRKKKQLVAERAILERYESQPKAPGVGPSKLAKRLAQLRSRITETDVEQV